MLIVLLHIFERTHKLVKIRYTSLQYTLLIIIIIKTWLHPKVLFFRACLDVSAGVETDRWIRVTAARFERLIANDPTANYRLGRGGIRRCTKILHTTFGSRDKNRGHYGVKHDLPRKLLGETALQKHERTPHITGKVELHTYHAHTISPFSASNVT